MKPIRSPRQLEQLGLPVIGVVPLIKSKPQHALASVPEREKRLAA